MLVKKLQSGSWKLKQFNFKCKTLCVALLLLFSTLISAQPKEYSRELILMGTAFKISVVLGADDWPKADTLITNAIGEIQRIESLISSWDKNSQTSLINRNAGVKPVMVDWELFALIERSIKVSDLTQGAFDITFAGMGKLWDFNTHSPIWPDSAAVKNARQNVNYQNILLNKKDTTVYLKTGMRIGFGGIGKGYAAYKAAKLLQGLGVENGVINAAGDLLSWGTSATAKDWKVGILNPDNKNKILATLNASNTSVVTSGDYEKYILHNGKRYAHIINPKTGYPTTGIKSATVVCVNPELADALATSIFVLGVEAGIELIDQLNGIECLIIDDQNKLHHSKGLELNFVEN